MWIGFSRLPILTTHVQDTAFTWSAAEGSRPPTQTHTLARARRREVTTLFLDSVLAPITRSSSVALVFPFQQAAYSGVLPCCNATNASGNHLLPANRSSSLPSQRCNVP